MPAIVLGLLLVLGTGVGGQAADLNFKEGLWELTLVMEMPGMPMPMPPQTFTHCLTRDNSLPTPPEGFQECKVSKMEVKGSRIIWEWACDTGEGPAAVGGEMEYQGDRLIGFLRVRQEDMEVVQKLSGKWLRECGAP